MSPEERNEFKINVRLINWDIAIRNHCFGIRRYYGLEDIIEPTNHKQLL